MSSGPFNNHELQAIRKTLMLDVAEASQYIGNVSPRSWQYWESGDRPIPDDVDMEMYALLQFRMNLIHELEKKLADGDKVKYYHAYDEWIDDMEENSVVTRKIYDDLIKEGDNDSPIFWKIWQSAVSDVFINNSVEIELV